MRRHLPVRRRLRVAEAYCRLLPMVPKRPHDDDEISLRERLSHKEVLIGSFVNLGSSLTTEVMGLAGFDWVVIDLEHGAGDEQILVGQLQALAHTGTAALVRVEGVDPARIQHALDVGADGVLVPRVRSVEQARACVDFCRYARHRGVARYNRSWHWGMRTRSYAEVDARVACAVQIETAQALELADEIAAVDGVDLVFVGPVDLAHALRLSGPEDPDLLAHVARVARAARAAGKAAGMLVGSVEQVGRYRELGFTVLGCSSDSGLLALAARDMASALDAVRLAQPRPQEAVG